MSKKKKKKKLKNNELELLRDIARLIVISKLLDIILELLN